MHVTVRLFCVVGCMIGLVACGFPRLPDIGIVPEGPHYGYVVSKAFVPASNKQATDYGLDLGAAKSGTPDGIVDNKLGVALAALAGYGFNVQGTVDTAIAKGSIILLVDFQTKDFMNSSAAGLSVKLGANPVPAACSSPTDTTCGHHLAGGAMFSIAADSSPDALVSGTIVNGTFNGGPGDIALQIAIGSTEPITLSLSNARAKATTITETGMTATVGGALSLTDLNTSVLPAIQGQVKSILDADCGAVTGRVPPGCGCMTASSGTILGLFDGDIAGTVKDCTISLEEIQGSALIRSLLGPDVCSTSSCTAPEALSIGIQVQTVKAVLP